MEPERMQSSDVPAWNEKGRHTLTFAEEQALEEAANRLLREAGPDPDAPYCSEKQLVRRFSRAVAADGAEYIEMLPDQSTYPGVRDELLFIASLTPLSRLERFCLLAWIHGWDQSEVSTALRWTGVQRCQQTVSRLLRSALRKCSDSCCVSFTAFSRHTVYRPPSKARPASLMLRCLACGEAYSAGLGFGRYCSLSCREALRYRRARRID